MRLRSVTARDMAEAMQRIREELGYDAIIVSTEETENGVLVRAATEKPDHPEPSADERASCSEPPAADASPPCDEPESRDNAPTATIRECLDFHGVPPALARELAAIAEETSASSPADKLSAALDQSIGFSRLDAASVRHPLMLVGEAGAGKTVTLAKLAAQARLAGREVVAVTADTVRAGGTEQLAAFLRAIGLELRRIDRTRNLSAAMEAAEPGSLVLIDTPAVDPFAPDPLTGEPFPPSEILSGQIEPVLVLPAGRQTDDAAESASALARALGVRRLIATRLDTARRYGAVLAAARAARISVAGLTASRRIAAGVKPVDPAAFAGLLLNQMASTAPAYRDAGQIQGNP